MKKLATMLVTLTILALVCPTPAAARGPGPDPVPTKTSIDPSRPALIVEATGILQRRGMTPLPSYGTHRIFDTRSKRLYALTSRRPALLHRFTGRRVTVYGRRIAGFPRGPGVPLLDVFRIVPLAPAAPA